jgi:hypothetical protein
MSKLEALFDILDLLSFKNIIRRFTLFIPIISISLIYSNALYSSENLDVKLRAINKVLKSETLCKNLGDYYWEIGDKNGKLLSGSSNGNISSGTIILIASASKLVFAAYIVERIQGNLSSKELPYLQMISGYDNLNPLLCSSRLTETPLDCFNTRNNNKINTDHIGKFSYNGGHFQKLMIDIGIGDLDNSELTKDLQNILGSDIKISYTSPQSAGGMSSSPAEYAKFLQKILRGELYITNLLGSNPVCTLPGICSNAVSSPSPYDWHYSIGHWVEDDENSDGAHSSAGAFGFYPWISQDKIYYGILARYKRQLKAGVDSAVCGKLIRRAFIETK